VHNDSREGETDVQALHNSKRTEAKVRTKHREKPVEKRQRPPDFGENQQDNLEYDEESVEDGPKDACRFIGYSAITKRKVSFMGRRKRE
jgi:hypothetical protein